MYPNLLAPLLSAAGFVIADLILVVARRPVARRLAARQLARRPGEAILAATGATLGTAIIVASLVVGDTLNFSVRQDAYRMLGPIDERISSTTAVAGAEVASRARMLGTDRDVDGVLSARYVQAAAQAGGAHDPTAEPRAVVWAVDLAAAARFGAAGGTSGLDGPTPGPGQVVLNARLADSLRVSTGDTVQLNVFGATRSFHVIRIVPERGLAGAGPSIAVNNNAFVAPSMFPAQASAADAAGVVSVTLVSNRGGVEGGANETDTVLLAIHRDLGSLARTTLVDAPKRDVLDAAQRTGDSLGALFLMIGSFSIIAGALLLVNIFVMLGDERKTQLGMLRAVGMTRSTLVSSLTLEGAAYSVAALVPGVLLGIGVGWGVARVAAEIFRSFSASGASLSISYAVTPTSLLNAAALGLLIGIAAIFVTSVRISRINVIAAIRDLATSPRARTRREMTIACTSAAVLFAGLAVPLVVNSQAEGSYLFPSVAAGLTIPVLRRRIGDRWAVSGVAALVLTWCLALPVIRPGLFDHASMAAFVVEGTLVALAGVALISENQVTLLAPLRAMRHRSADNALATRLAIAYPVAKRFRTGATLVMYTLITLVLVLLVEVAGVLDTSISSEVAKATAGYGLRVDVNPAQAQETISDLRQTEDRDIARLTTLTSAAALATDPGKRTDRLLHALAVGVDPDMLTAMRFDSRLPGLGTDAEVWVRLASDPRYVVVDHYFGATGGPNGHYYSPGDTFTVVDPRKGTRETKIIAGVLSSGLIFYPGAAVGTAYPFVASASAIDQQFGLAAVRATALVAVRAGVDLPALAARLQARYLDAGLVATDVGAAVRRMFSANVAFFRLLQGFLALGLAVGITGLGVIMIRAVRERRRTIGVLRALGVQARTMRRSFLLESSLIAVQGVLLGSVLGVITTWLMYQKSATFDGARGGFPVEWLTIAVLLGATLALSLAATIGPARRAAAILPALAVRVSE